MAFITAETRSDLIELAVAMLKQAPSAALLDELITLSTDGGSLADAADHIAKTDAFKAEYPSFQTAEQYATEIFDNITTGGTIAADVRTLVIELATSMLVTGNVSKAGLALEISKVLSDPATLLHPDFADIAQSFQNRADAAEYFVVTKELGGSTAAELAAAIASVTSDAATLTAANAAADATASAEEVVPGQTFTLTTGLDTLTGGTGGDTFNAVDGDAIAGVGPVTTINAGDSINAGAGTDRLSIVASGANATSAQVASSTIEEIALYNNTAAAYTVDTTLMTGLTDLYVVAGTDDAVFAAVASTPNVHMTASANDVTVTTTFAATAGPADAATVALTGALPTGAGATLLYDGIETLNVVTAGSATGAGTRVLTLDSNALETVNLSGSAAAFISAAMQGAEIVDQVGTVDASAMTGALTATVTAGASGVLSVTGGAGADTLTVNAGAMTEDLTIDGGAGVDTLVVTAAAYDEDSTTGQVGDGVTNMEVLRVTGSADVAAFSNNTFASFQSAGSAAIGEIGTDAVSLAMLADGAVSLDRATDGAADAATVTFANPSLTEMTVTSLNVADEETVTINSVSAISAGAAAANTIGTLTGTDLTSLTIAGNRDFTITNAITGTKLATLDASGLTGTGTALIINASNSTADMTVTGGAGVEAVEGATMNTITTGSGDDAITTGDYADTIDAGNGDNTVVAGDGDNDITTGRGDDTITVGDGDNSIDAGIGDDTVTAGGTTTSAAVFDTNEVDLGNGDDTYTGGAGRDIVTLGAGDDTVDTGAGTDSIYMSDFDDDDVVNGGAGADTLSVSALATGAAAAAAQVQGEAVFVDVTPGASGTSSPQFTAVESVYMQVHLADDNVEGTAATNETVDFAASSGITNLYLEVDDGTAGGANNQGVLTLSEVDASAIHLLDRGTTDDLGELVVAGAGQAALTLKGFDFDGGTDLTISDVDAVTLTSYQSSSVLAVGDTAYGDVEADDADTVTVTMASTAAALAGATLTVNSLSADGATAINANAGSNTTLAITAGITSSSDALDTMAITVADDGVMTVGTDIESTGAEMTSATITIGVAGSLTVTDQIDLESAEDVTVTVGAAGTFDINDFVVGGDVVINATMGSSLTIDVFGESGITGTFDINGRGTLVNAFAIDGDTTVNIAGFTDTVAGGFTITTNGNDDMGFVGNNDAITLTAGNGDNVITTGTAGDTITTGSGADEISSGAGADTITSGAGIDDINAGAGADTITGGAGADTIAGGTGADLFTIAANADFGDVISDFESGSDRFALDVVRTITDVVTAAGTGVTTVATQTQSTSAITVSGTIAGTITAALANTAGGIFGDAFIAGTTAAGTLVTASATATVTPTQTTTTFTQALTGVVSGTLSAVLGGTLNIINNAGATGTLTFATTLSASNSLALTSSQVFTFTGTGTAAFKAAIASATGAFATGTTNFAAFGIGGSGTIFIANIENGTTASSTNTTSNRIQTADITAVRTIGTVAGITATDIVII